MKKFIAGGILGLSAIGLISLEPSLAQSNDKFFCTQTSNGEYVTMVNTNKGPLALIIWQGWASGSGWTPEKRCQQGTSRFQQHYNQGTLKYLRTGQINNYPVLCIASTQGGTCPQDNVIATLPLGGDAQGTLKQIEDIRRGAQTQPVSLSTKEVFSYDENGELYLNLDKILQEDIASEENEPLW
jgi:hypothetical protein